MIKRNQEMTEQQKQSAVEVSPGLFRMSAEELEKLPCRPLAKGESFISYQDLCRSLLENK
jgi:hypothetical protein